MPHHFTEKLAKLRAFFDDPKIREECTAPISAYLLPRTDAHQSEYLTERDSRIRFISGFSGSNAFAVITRNEALLWTDGRYFIQAKSELEAGWTLMEEGVPGAISPSEWLAANLPAPAVVAFDPQLYSYSNARTLQRRLEFYKIKAVPLKQNLVDILWVDRPIEPIRQVIALKPSEYGVESSEKVEEVRKKLLSKKCQSAIFTALDDVAWLLNIRGGDIPYNPVVFSVVVLTPTTVHLFIDTGKLSEELRRHLRLVVIHEYEEAMEWIKGWYKKEAGGNQEFKIYIPDSTNFEIGSIFDHTHCIFGSSMIQTMKSVKNDTELDGMRSSHITDSAAIVRFLSWLEQQVSMGIVVTEASAAEMIYCMRSQIPGFMGLSFETIAAVDEHAALPHYKLTEKSGKRRITSNCVFLIDSGGHYRNGTTDVTRTIAFGSSVTDDFRRHFTLVLKGHISTARMVFPDSIHGIRIDIMARQHLWSDGLDFGHGVGHGVGHFLNVHEGPAGIGFRRYTPDGVLREKMVVTIEPGYYLESRYGIRIENCYEIVKANSLRSEAKNFLTFDSLTYVPIQKSLIQSDLLTKEEVDWINCYHKACVEKLSPLLERSEWNEENEWLKNACSPL